MRMEPFRIPVHALGFAVLVLLIPGLQFIPAKAAADEFAVPAYTIDGRFGSNCLRKNAFTDEPVCMVPFPRLIAEPERFDGKYILLFGFLATRHGMTALFSGTESSKHILPFEYVDLGKIPPEIEPLLEKGVWVVATGKFDAKFSGPRMSLGAIWQPLDIHLFEDQKALPPSLPPFLKPKKPVVAPPTLK